MEKRLVVDEENSIDDYLAQEENLAVVDCCFSGDNVLHSSRLVEIYSSVCSGDDFGWMSLLMQVIQSRFSGKYALGGSDSARVSECMFEGEKALYGAKNGLVSNSEFTGDCALESSEHMQIYAAKFSGSSAFKNAANLECYINDTINEIEEPKSGFMVAERIERVKGNSGAHIYALKIGEGAEYCTIIEKKHLRKDVDERNIEEAIEQIVEEYDTAETLDEWECQKESRNNKWAEERTNKEHRLEREMFEIEQKFKHHIGEWNHRRYFLSKKDIIINSRFAREANAHYRTVMDIMKAHPNIAECLTYDSDCSRLAIPHNLWEDRKRYLMQIGIAGGALCGIVGGLSVL